MYVLSLPCKESHVIYVFYFTGHVGQNILLMLKHGRISVVDLPFLFISFMSAIYVIPIHLGWWTLLVLRFRLLLLVISHYGVSHYYYFPWWDMIFNLLVPFAIYGNSLWFIHYANILKMSFPVTWLVLTDLYIMSLHLLSLGNFHRVTYQPTTSKWQR